MKQSIGTGVVLLALAAVIIGQGRLGSEIAARQARVPADRSANEGPKFRVDPTWPEIPNNWQFGQVASVSIDVSGSRVGAAASRNVER